MAIFKVLKHNLKLKIFWSFTTKKHIHLVLTNQDMESTLFPPPPPWEIRRKYPIRALRSKKNVTKTLLWNAVQGSDLTRPKQTRHPDSVINVTCTIEQEFLWSIQDSLWRQRKQATARHTILLAHYDIKVIRKFCFKA